MGKRNQNLIDQEVTFAPDEELVSVTDLRGVVTYSNDKFCEVAGFTREELVGKNHNIVRHPDMPKAAFADLWSKLKAKQAWRGAVKNRCKDGRYYWVDAYVTPVYEDGNLTGFQSVRRYLKPEYRKRAEALYKKINNGEKADSKWSLSMSVKQGIYLAVAIAACLLTIFASPYFALLLIALPYLIFKEELFGLHQYLNKSQQKYDSVSRFVFSGTGVISIADFPSKMHEGAIRTIIGRVIDSSTSLYDVVVELKKAAEKATLGVEKETAEVYQVSTAIEEMGASIQEVANNVTLTSQKIEVANQGCEKATKAMTETMQKVSKLADDVESSANASGQLAEEAQRIGNVMSEIQGIADQTNLLALNAAIEAARAGEHGRGFAVVADEVRALSSRTHSATEQIQTSINEIQSTLLTWAKSMNEGKDAAIECVADTRQSRELIEGVYQQISEISGLAFQISTAAEQQTLVSQEVNKSILNVSAASQENLEQVNFVKDASNDINAKAKVLASLGLTFG
ncbi:methyl-accepting chemotaxis protein [Aliiglaciecola lipolytica]|uniref:Aerotaxis receptor n=1 Tax=Aliiglaciecola lipolytica E3 TaxID=1127673 RepID=K6Y565_9ALTE|nr:PAS domain-containing methyl-accepting chemotaxis protein [Aliiglaciecola lipolytica]GAC13382.1 aerotaxis receptor [Aliiglaciecola lipolytica E3]